MIRLLLLVILPAALARPAAAQDSSAVNNFVHLPGTHTAPLGTLGHVEKRGDGPVDLILIPGAAFGWDAWRDFMTRNLDRYTMYALTLPGYGGTPPPPTPDEVDFTKPIWLDAVDAAISRLIDERCLDHPFVVGHHLQGTYHALEAGLKYAQKISGVIVVAGEPRRYVPAPGDSTRRTPGTMAQRRTLVHDQWQPFFRTVTTERWKQGMYAPSYYSIDSTRAQALWDVTAAVPVPIQVTYFMEYLNTDLGSQMANLRAPLLAIIPVPPDLTGEQRDLFEQVNPWVLGLPEVPDMTREYVDGTRAFVMMDQPDVFDHLVAAFVKAHQQ